MSLEQKEENMVLFVELLESVDFREAVGNLAREFREKHPTSLSLLRQGYVRPKSYEGQVLLRPPEADYVRTGGSRQ